MLKDLENELKDSAHEDLNDYSNDETDGRGKHEPIDVKPLVLKTHMRNDVNIRNMLADMRCAPIHPRRVERPKKINIPPAPTFYKILDKPMPMSFSSYLSNPGGGGSRYCVKPWVSNLKQYQNTDVPLGIFLQDYCFDTNFRYVFVNYARMRYTIDIKKLISINIDLHVGKFGACLLVLAWQSAIGQ